MTEREQQNPARTLSQVPLDTLNRFAAETLAPGYTLTPIRTKKDEQGRMIPGTELIGIQPNGEFYPFSEFWFMDANQPSGWRARDFTQPAGMKMLLERICRLGFECVLFNGTYHVELDTGPSDGSDNINSSSSDLGRAILEAFCLSEGFQVEGA